MTDEEREHLAALVAAKLTKRPAQRPILQALMGASLTVMGGVCSATFGMCHVRDDYRDEFRDMKQSTTQAAAAIVRVETESKERDDKLDLKLDKATTWLDQRIDKAMADHMQYQHNKRGTSGASFPLRPPWLLVDAPITLGLFP